MLIKNGLLWRFIKYRSHKGPQRSMRKVKVASECWQNQNISVPQPLALARREIKNIYLSTRRCTLCTCSKFIGLRVHQLPDELLDSG